MCVRPSASERDRRFAEGLLAGSRERQLIRAGRKKLSHRISTVRLVNPVLHLVGTLCTLVRVETIPLTDFQSVAAKMISAHRIPDAVRYG
jgi:hypothetical protein